HRIKWSAVFHPVVLSKHLLHFQFNTVFSQRRPRCDAGALTGGKEHLHAHQVLTRVQQSITMINAHALDQIFRQQLPQQLVRGGKHARVLHAQPDQIIDVKEPPVINFLAGDPPVRQAINLLLQQPVQIIKAARIAWHSVMKLQSSFREPARITRLLDEPKEGFHERSNGPPALADQFAILCAVRRQAAQPRQHVAQFLISDLIVERLKDERNGLRIKRQALVKVLDVESSFIKDQFDMAALQFGAILVSQNRNQELVLEFLLDGVPVNVKKFREL